MIYGICRCNAGWFLGWMLIGGLWLFTLVSAMTIGIFVLPVAMATTAFAVGRPRSRVGRPGLASGMALPLLLVAWLNRDGPGMVCHATKGGESCADQWSPWPFYVPGLLLFVGGVVWFVRRSQHGCVRRKAARDPNVTGSWT